MQLREEPIVRSGRSVADGAGAGEATRLLALRNLQILDSGREAQFDEIARLAATICQAPTAFVTFVDRSRVWFKACTGVNPGEVDRVTSFCSPAIDQPEPIFEVPDALRDPVFAQAPSVTGPPFIRFYAGAPLVIDGAALGTLCVMDVVPRKLTDGQRESLLMLARQIVRLLEYRTVARQLAQAHQSRDLAEAETSIFGKAVNHSVNGLLFFGKRTPASESTIWFANDYFCKAIGEEASRLNGRPIRSIVIERANRAAGRKLRALLASGACQNVPLAFHGSGGPERRFELTVITIDRVNDEDVHLAVLHDATEQHAANIALREKRIVEARNEALVKSEGRLRELFAGTPAIMYTLDRDLRFLSSLGGGLRSIELRPDHLVGMLLADITSPEQFGATLQNHKRAFAGESVMFESDIFGRPFRTFLEPLRDANDATCGVSGISFDLSEVARAEARVATTDAVTGLPNRSALASFLETCERTETPSHCFLLDVHRFHCINEAFGRAFGDRVLAAIAVRLQSLAGNSLVARVESDVFAVVCPGTVDASERAEQIYEAFADSIEVDDRRVSVALAIGIASIQPGATVEAVLFEAQLAIAAAEKLGVNKFAFFDSALAEAALRRSLLDRDIQSAIERDELAVQYQPIVDARGELVKMEALLRWRHPVLGPIGPDEFIAIAEENGAIVPIGRWVMQAACEQVGIVRRACGRPLRVAVNVSAKQFMDADFLHFIMQALARYDLPADALEIEITETTLVSNPADATELLAQLRRLGVTVSVDDFGTGYSSLSSLRHLPIDNVKIDRSFVSATPASSEACAIVETILGLASKLSLRVIAEGVETDDQAAYLREQGCEMLQGYRFSRPLPAAALLAYVKAH